MKIALTGHLKCPKNYFLRQISVVKDKTIAKGRILSGSDFSAEYDIPDPCYGGLESLA